MKIDTSKIPNWETLTAEQKAFIEGLELTEDKPAAAQGNTVKTVPKTMFDKLASEFAELKRKRDSELTDAQKAQEKNEEREQHFKELEDKIKYFDLRDSFLNKGYDAETSAKLADAVGKNDMEVFTTVSKEYLDKRLEEARQVAREQLLRQGTGVGTAGAATNATTKKPEDMTYAELVEYQKNGGKI